MILNYIKEFVNICTYLKKKETKIKKGFFIVEKEEIQELLSKYAYDTPQSKLKIWKQLNWISCEDGRLTKRCYVGDGKYKTYINIYISVFEALQELL